MSESKSLVKLQRLLMSDSDMAAAAQQLMQLSDEDNNSSSSSSSSSSNSNGNNNNNNNDSKKIKGKIINSKRIFFEQSQYEITSAKIEEIFGKEEETLRSIKKRRYRFLDSIYKDTKPIKVSYGKNLWY